MRVFLLDDESNALKTVKAYLNKTSLKGAAIKEASTIDEAIEVLSTFSADLALLDINLAGGTSFDLLSRLDKIDFKIIFITAYDEYAVKAFKFNAIDYILKPINPLEFNAAIEKVLESGQSVNKDQLKQFNETISTGSTNKLILKDNKAMHFVRISDIVQCKSESNYTLFSLVDGSEIIISKTLAEYEELLRGKGFFRSHRSHLINLHQIKKYDKREGGFIQMNNKENVPLSRGKKDVFMQLIEKL